MEQSLKEWIPLLGALITAVSAAVAAVVIHRQRLEHERTINEVEALRLLLDEGAQLLEEGFQIEGEFSLRAVAWEDRETLDEYQDALDTRSQEYARQAMRYQARLQLWFPPDEPVVALWEQAYRAIGSALSVFRAGLAPSTRPGDPDYGSMEQEAAESAFEWFGAARKVMRPHLADESPGRDVRWSLRQRRSWTS